MTRLPSCHAQLIKTRCANSHLFPLGGCFSCWSRCGHHFGPSLAPQTCTVGVRMFIVELDLKHLRPNFDLCRIRFLQGGPVLGSCLPLLLGRSQQRSFWQQLRCSLSMSQLGFCLSGLCCPTKWILIRVSCFLHCQLLFSAERMTLVDVSRRLLSSSAFYAMSRQHVQFEARETPRDLKQVLSNSSKHTNFSDKATPLSVQDDGNDMTVT